METPDRSAKHRLVLELGRGGMGIVYLAVAERPGGFRKLKVVKQLRRDLAGDLQFLQMFLDEARLCARLNHPNIVQTNEVGFDGRDYFLEMEYLEGQSFDAVLRRASKALPGGLPLPCALWLIAQTLAGLHHAHELKEIDGTPLGVVHRDVSPHNVIVTYDGAVKVLDFGIAKAADAVAETRTGVVKGKVAYMAPEQAARAHSEKTGVDRRADVFAVGVMLWQVATGKRMWEGLEEVEIFLKLQSGEMPRARSANPEVPEALDAICAKALAAKPEERYATAADLQNAIEEYLDATNARVGSRQVGKLVSELFAERRAAVQAEVEEQLRALSGRLPGSVNIPALEDTKAFLETATGPTRETKVPSGDLARRREGDPSAAATPPTNTERPTRLEGRKAENTGDTAPTDGEASGKDGADAGAKENTRTTTGISSAAPYAPRTVRARPTALLAALAGMLAVLVGGGWVANVSRSRSPTARVGVPAVASARPSKAGASHCEKSADCGGSEPSICRAGKCIALASKECHVVAAPGAVQNDSTLWLGGMFPLTGPYAEDAGKLNAREIEVAWKDFDEVTHGLPSADGTGPGRPIGLVMCDDNDDPVAVAHHLVVDLRIPAVFGFATSKEVVDLASSVFIPSGTLAMSVMNGSPLISTIPNPIGKERLVWRSVLTGRSVIEPLTRLIPQIVSPALRARGALKPGESLRVALLREGSLNGLSQSDVVTHSLAFNGKNALANGPDFGEFVVHADDDAESDAELAAQMVKMAPHVVIAGFDVDRRIVARVEESWKGGRRPLYFVTGNVGGPDLDALLVKDPKLRQRDFGIYGPEETPTNLRFTLRYNEGLPEAKKLAYTMTPSAEYDGFYTVAYAAYLASLGGNDITGEAIARSIPSLCPPGDPMEVGPGNILAGFEMLRQKRRIDLVGASSALDYDLSSGDVTSDLILMCMQPLRTGGYEPQEIEVRYDARERRWTGQLKCP